MVSWIGLTQRPVVYRRQERFAGETKYPLSKMIRFAIDAITGFSIRPLRIAIYLGVLFGLGGLIVLAYTLYTWLSGQTLHGWTSLMAVVLVLGRVTLLGVGRLGGYFGRLY